MAMARSTEILVVAEEEEAVLELKKTPAELEVAPGPVSQTYKVRTFAGLFSKFSKFLLVQVYFFQFVEYHLKVWCQ